MFRRRNLMRATALLATAGLAARAWGKAGEPPLPKTGSMLTIPSLTLLDSRPWGPGSVGGKTLVVYWWASWCPFCAVQSPHIEALWRARKAQGLEVLALSIDKQPATAAAYLKAKGYSFPAAMLTPEVAASLPRPAGLPVVVVLKLAPDGAAGRVVFAEAGEMFPEDIEGLKKYI